MDLIERIRAIVDGKSFVGFTYQQLLVIRSLVKARIDDLDQPGGRAKQYDDERKELLPMYRDIVADIDRVFEQ